MNSDEKNWISLDDAAFKLKIARGTLLKMAAQRQPNIMLGWRPSRPVTLHSIEINGTEVSWPDCNYSEESPENYILSGAFMFDLDVCPGWTRLFSWIERGGGPYGDPFLLQEPLIIYDCVNKCYLSLNPSPASVDPNIYYFPTLQELVICDSELVKYENNIKLPKIGIQKIRVELIKEYLKNHEVDLRNKKNEKGKKGTLSRLREALLHSKGSQGNFIFASTKPDSNNLPNSKTLTAAWIQVQKENSK